MKVSIIIPTYNSALTLERSIESALNQDFPKDEFEVIVINDGSTDNTLEILKKYGEKIRVINQANQGALRASNNGFRAALGEYVIKLDSDDKFEKDILKEMALVLDKNPGIDFVYCDYYETKTNGETFLVSCCANIFNTIGIGIMFRKQKFQEQGFFNAKTMFAEYDLLLKTQDIWKGYCIEKPLFYYLRRGESITGKQGWIEKAILQLKELYPKDIAKIEKIRPY
ncbi:MAG: glycosyltransferase family A protein [Candidatus Pacebacteria bacterium]|nr:glycosyltransferase family A protein [Candidatus Paceibacterota bacterium]